MNVGRANLHATNLKTARSVPPAGATARKEWYLKRMGTARAASRKSAAAVCLKGKSMSRTLKFPFQTARSASALVVESWRTAR